MQGIEAFAMVSTIGIIGATVVSVARAFFNRGARRALPTSATDSALQDRLDRLEGAIQAIAIETERIAEGQRFTTKLLSHPGSHIPHAPVDASPAMAAQALPAPGITERQPAQ